KVVKPWPGFFVLRHGDESEIFGARGIGEFVEAGLDERAGDLAGAVGAEIEKYDGVVVANQAARRGGFSRRGFGGNHDGRSEFVGDAFFVTRANGGDGI